MKVFLIFAFVIGGLSVVAQEHVIPRGFGVLAEKTGDLDKDGIPEKVIVYNTTDTTDEGITRKLYILKYVDSKWIGWKQSANAVLKSQQGGMMGDPFEGIEVKNGLLIVSVAGGSSWKWRTRISTGFRTMNLSSSAIQAMQVSPVNTGQTLTLIFPPGKSSTKKNTRIVIRTRKFISGKQKPFTGKASA